MNLILIKGFLSLIHINNIHMKFQKIGKKEYPGFPGYLTYSIEIMCWNCVYFPTIVPLSPEPFDLVGL